MSDFQRESVVRVNEQRDLETDDEMVHRFSTQLYKDINYITQFVDCNKLKFTRFTSKSCEGCPIYKNNECGFKTIGKISHDLMWRTNK
jgi:hypothetical protein